jgi:serralysin
LVAQTATVSGPGAGVESFVSFENAVGGAGKDVLLAGDGANRLDGGSGSDSIAGGGGGDILRGGEGLDTLDGGAGADTLWGGAWTDTYLVDDPGDRIFELPSEGGDLVLSRVSFTLPAEVERLVLVGEGALEATGSGDGNGLTGNDWANRLDGLSGRDRLDGLGGDDTLLGGNHDDTLIGGAGSDLLTGGTGADRFRFDSAGEGADSIADFQSGWDGIQVVSANFASLPLGTLDPSRLVAAGTALQSGDAVFIYDSASGALAFDADGNGAQAAAPIATLTGPKTLTAADIVAVAA